MRLLQYKDLDPTAVRSPFDKVRAAIEADDFRSADVKKVSPGRYYRAKLDYANRLLPQLAQADGKTVCLALEVIGNPAYERSRFLCGATVDEARIDREPGALPGWTRVEDFARRSVFQSASATCRPMRPATSRTCCGRPTCMGSTMPASWARRR